MEKTTTVKNARGASAKETPKRNAAKIQRNPVAERANMDAYDELLMFSGQGAGRRSRADAYDDPPRKGASRAGKPVTRRVETDAYDDPFAPQPEKKARAKKPAQADPYDDPLAPPRKKATRAKKPVQADPYDDPLAPPRKKAVRAKKPARDPYDEPLMGAEAGREPEDEFDRYVARMEGEARGRKRARGPKGGGPGGGRPGLTWLLTALILACFAVGGVQLVKYAGFIRMRNAVDRSTYFAGTSVENVDVSGMTLADAIDHWDKAIESRYTGRTVTLDDGTGVTAPQMGYRSDYRQVLEGVWNAQKSGTLKERYESLKAQTGEAVNYDVTRVPYDDAVIRQFAAYVASAVDAPYADASVAGFDMGSYAFTFTEGRSGAALDQEQLVADIRAALDAGGGAVARRIGTLHPAVSVQDLQNQYGLVASAITDASSSTDNRLTNIKLALASINGLALDPGEEFSFNGVVGQRTAARGYKMAKAFSGGEVTEELGGGICQVSTTLFNAAVKANLKITERNPHSMPVSYIDKGKDATVNWGSQDLRFVNNTDSTVYIVSILTSDKRVKIGVFGKTIPNGVYITVESEVVETVEFKTTYQENAFLAPGTQSVLQEGRTGYKAVAYKMIWSADGKLLDKQQIYTSTYAKRDAIIEVAKQ